MRKIFLIVLFLILTLNMVMAAQNDSVGKSNKNITRGDNGPREIKNQTNQGIGQELSQLIRERKEEIKSGEYNGSLGQLLKVRELAHNLIELRSGNTSAQTDLNITVEIDSENKTKFKIKLKNGQEREIKIMPNTASERALERLRLKVCSPENNCTIQLKEVGNDNNQTIQYEIQLERHARILGIFQKKMKVRANVDAESGYTKVNKPWWAFIATTTED